MVNIISKQMHDYLEGKVEREMLVLSESYRKKHPALDMTESSQNLSKYDLIDYKVIADENVINQSLEKNRQAAIAQQNANKTLGDYEKKTFYDSERPFTDQPGLPPDDGLEDESDSPDGLETESHSPSVHSARRSKDKLPLCEDAVFYGDTSERRCPINRVIAMLDGHGLERRYHDSIGENQAVALFKERCIDALNESYDEVSQALPSHTQRAKIYNALKLAPVKIDRKQFLEHGTTVTLCAFDDDDNLWVANVGDCRALLLNKTGKVEQLTEDQSPVNWVEDKEGSGEHLEATRYADQIYSRGGFVSNTARQHPYFPGGRVEGVLEPARSIGDHKGTKLSATPRPKITFVEKPKGGWAGYTLLVFTDGLTKVATTDEIGEKAKALMKRGVSKEQLAAQLVTHVTH